MNVVEVCKIYDQDNPTKSFPSLPRIKAVYEGKNEEVEPVYFLAPKNPWQTRPPGMNQDPSTFVNTCNSQYNS